MKNIYKRFDQYLLDIGEKLGNGQYGSVYKGYYYTQDEFSEKYNRTLAIKETHRPVGFNKEEQEVKTVAAIKEINILSQLNHPNIIKFIDAKQTQNNIYLIMEFCNGGTFSSLLKEKYSDDKVMSEIEVLNYFREIIDAFRYLREKNMVHRDIKPDNILVHDGVLKLADFGFAREIGAQEDQKTVTGTPLFRDPNIVQEKEKGYSNKSDIFSLGVLLWHMFYNDPLEDAASYPWYAENRIQLINNMMEKPIQFPAHRKVSPQIQALIKQMVIIDEEKRISWEKLFDHPSLKTKLDNSISMGLFKNNSLSKSVPLEKNEETLIVNNYEENFDHKQAEIYTQKVKDHEKLKDMKNICVNRIDFEQQVANFIFSTAYKYQKNLFNQYEIPEVLSCQMLYILFKKCFLKYSILRDMIKEKSNLFCFPLDCWSAFLADIKMVVKIQKGIQQQYETCENNFQTFYKAAVEYFELYNQKNTNIQSDFEMDYEYVDEVMRDTFISLIEPLIGIQKKLQVEQELENRESILLDVVYNLLMIYTMETTLVFDSKNQKDFRKFYNERKIIPKKAIFIRIIKAYKEFKFL